MASNSLQYMCRPCIWPALGIYIMFLPQIIGIKPSSSSDLFSQWNISSAMKCLDNIVIMRVSSAYLRIWPLGLQYQGKQGEEVGSLSLGGYSGGNSSDFARTNEVGRGSLQHCSVESLTASMGISQEYFLEIKICWPEDFVSQNYNPSPGRIWSILQYPW